MEKIYIVSLELDGSAADSLTQSIKERDNKYLEFWQHMVDNKLAGAVVVREDIVDDNRYKEAKDGEQYYFDTLDWNNTKTLFQKKYHPRMMKSKADLERQITRIAANHPNHRLYNKAQLLVIYYNHNISESLENLMYWKEWKVLDRNPETKIQAEDMLRKMHETVYHRDLYTARVKK